MQHGNGWGNPAFPFLGKGKGAEKQGSEWTFRPQRFQVDFHDLMKMNLELFSLVGRFMPEGWAHRAGLPSVVAASMRSFAAPSRRSAPH